MKLRVSKFINNINKRIYQIYNSYATLNKYGYPPNIVVSLTSISTKHYTPPPGILKTTNNYEQLISINRQ